MKQIDDISNLQITFADFSVTSKFVTRLEVLVAPQSFIYIRWWSGGLSSDSGHVSRY